MIKFFRKIRQDLLSRGKSGKYLKYALGEIVLVVIGIMIAIQINNANQKRLDRETLQGYLNSIAQNIESDLKKAEKINSIRLEIFPRLRLAGRRMDPEYYQIRAEVYDEQFSPGYPYSVENIDFVSRAINDAWTTRYLTPNLSGFESLKSSGFLSQLQGSDLEKVIFNYYNLIDDLITTENNYNISIRNSFDEFLNADLPGTFAFFNAGSRDWQTEIGEGYEAMIDDIMVHPTLIPVFLVPYELIIKYENIIITGNVLKKMIIDGESSFSQESLDQLSRVYNEYDDTPYAKVMRSGYVTHGYDRGIASAYNSQGVNFQFLGSHATIQFKNEPWAVLYFYTGYGVPDPNRVKDFSNFETLRLKLRGTQGGEKVDIALKDITNPTDGSETKVQLTLTNEWQFYDISLNKFKPTNMEKLFMVTSFITENQAITIEVESIEFL
ncbi:DUF6090 family protein [Portibacter marinus]|uniref:DUF6090 family protein n=1 Tax=Portibacter marinus TaxID=2898660 RepID=UPI001F42222A|nr:DUF6090 family protein [Portibacter marinus]